MTAFADTPGAALARGVCRFLLDAGAAPVTEVALPHARRVDVIALDAGGQVIVVEVKASVADFRADAKWTEYLPWCDAFYFAVDAGFPLDALPDGEGVIVADAWSAEILRPAAARRLAPARRKALTLRVARAAATRLRRALDPALGCAMAPRLSAAAGET